MEGARRFAFTAFLVLLISISYSCLPGSANVSRRHVLNETVETPFHKVANVRLMKSRFDE
jgi:hypothetical protein